MCQSAGTDHDKEGKRCDNRCHQNCCYIGRGKQQIHQKFLFKEHQARTTDSPDTRFSIVLHGLRLMPTYTWMHIHVEAFADRHIRQQTRKMPTPLLHTHTHTHSMTAIELCIPISLNTKYLASSATVYLVGVVICLGSDGVQPHELEVGHPISIGAERVTVSSSPPHRMHELREHTASHVCPCVTCVFGRSIQ